jgi:RNA polymerase sigma-70 factor (ECF subfamily)
MLIAWRRRGEYSSEDARLWLFGVAHHVVANERRSALRRERLAERARQEAATRPAVADSDETDGQRVRALLETLPPAEQEALRLIEWDQLDIDEASRVTGCSRATFRVRLHRARRRFARLLADQGAHPGAVPVASAGTATTSMRGARS